jgi:hypothetical protein
MMAVERGEGGGPSAAVGRLDGAFNLDVIEVGSPSLGAV